MSLFLRTNGSAPRDRVDPDLTLDVGLSTSRGSVIGAWPAEAAGTFIPGRGFLVVGQLAGVTRWDVADSAISGVSGGVDGGVWKSSTTF